MMRVPYVVYKQIQTIETDMIHTLNNPSPYIEQTCHKCPVKNQ